MSNIRSHRWSIIKYAAVIHLCLVVCGAAKLNLHQPFFGDAIDAYQSYSGAGTSYGFFAPGVAAERRIIWHGYNAKTNTWTTDSEQGPTREVTLRLSTVAGLFSQDGGHDLLAASWAAWMFGKHPDVSTSIIEIQAYVVPTMQEYRDGRRPQWQVIGAFAFERKNAGS
jgi:hypothetical protein